MTSESVGVDDVAARICFARNGAPKGESQDVGWRGKVKFPLDGFTLTAKDRPNCFRFSLLSHVPLCPEIVVRFTCTRGSLVTASAIMASILGCYCIVD